MARCKCEGCDGSGIRPGAPNHSGRPVPRGFVVVERCDTCEKFQTDEIAALHYGREVSIRFSDSNPQGRYSDVICRPRRTRKGVARG